MKLLSPTPKMLLVSSYPPRECGIATFSQDLARSIDSVFGCTLPIEVCALQNDRKKIVYNKEVAYELYTQDIHEYQRVADQVNERNDIGMILIQHEFGLYAGDYGDHILSFMLAANKPIATVFHTVLPDPDQKREKVVNAIVSLSEKIIVLTNRSKAILVEHYQCTADQVEVIPHGTHIVLWKDKAALKKQYGYENNRVLSSFGLLGENKSIETVLYALPDVVKRFPEVVFLVLGKTHPEIIKDRGEEYRNKLIAITKELGIEKHVQFVNEYLPLNKLLDYLNFSDLYLFTSKDPHQAVSGTLAYAQAAGCPVISTPIPHAKEIIDDGTGILLDEFQNSEKFKEAILHLLENEQKRIDLSRNAFSKTRATCWENSDIAYANIFGEMTNKAEDLGFQLPRVNLDHIREMTTDFGMIQFSDFGMPDTGSGYTLDDNARALIAMVTHYSACQDRNVLALVHTYLNFIEFVQQEDGKFQNYVDIEKNITPQNSEVNLEDSNGRALWSLGYTLSLSNELPEALAQQAEKCWQKAINNVENITSPRAMGFALKGLYYYHSVKQDAETVRLAEVLAGRLMDHYHLTSDPDWHWYEDYMTYSNSILPEALMYAHLITGNEHYKEIAVVTFDFLLANYFMKGKIKVISNKGWFHKRNERTFFGEQPIEIAYTVMALELFYEVTEKKKYRDQLGIAFSWFLGNNHLGQIIYNPVNGGCYDGLEKSHVNINQGAESTICYFIARSVMEKHFNNGTGTLKNRKTPVFLCDCNEDNCKREHGRKVGHKLTI